MRITEDINIHFYEEGEPGFYNGSSSEIPVIFSKNIDQFLNGETVVKDAEITALCKSSQVPSLTVNKTLNVRSKTYYIVEWDVLQNSDLTLCYLSENQV